MTYVSKERLYLDADGKVVKDGDPSASTLLVGAGGELDDPTAKRYKLKGGDVKTYDAAADHEDKHGGETDAQAADAHARMLAGEPDPDGPAVTGERGDVKATDAPPATKAVSRAPSNKGA